MAAVCLSVFSVFFSATGLRRTHTESLMACTSASPLQKRSSEHPSPQKVSISGFVIALCNETLLPLNPQPVRFIFPITTKSFAYAKRSETFFICGKGARYLAYCRQNFYRQRHARLIA